MPVKYIGVQELHIDGIAANKLSANQEDSSTFTRLKRELSEHGMIDLPVVLANNGAYRAVAGWHRLKAWQELGHQTCPCVVLEGTLSKEQEFNLVNNLNRIRGEVTRQAVTRVIRANNLDVAALDLFKLPLASLLPNENPLGKNDDVIRAARLRDLSLEIAERIAEVILDQKDEAVIVFRVQDKMAGVLRLRLSVQQIRRSLAVLKTMLETTFADWLDTKPTDEGESDQLAHP